MRFSTLGAFADQVLRLFICLDKLSSLDTVRDELAGSED